jgi:endogenous inhibitor of DNA gyrase (YacG/DUF329 family)
MSSTPLPYRQVPCPQCGKICEWRPENKWRPFCSERCKLIDLGCWASESYQLPVQEEDAGPEDDEAH